jgi:hypothetical protein
MILLYRHSHSLLSNCCTYTHRQQIHLQTWVTLLRGICLFATFESLKVCCTENIVIYLAQVNDVPWAVVVILDNVKVFTLNYISIIDQPCFYSLWLVVFLLHIQSTANIAYKKPYFASRCGRWSRKSYYIYHLGCLSYHLPINLYESVHIES